MGCFMERHKPWQCTDRPTELTKLGTIVLLGGNSETARLISIDEHVWVR